jgi:hypothetical protein
MEHEATVDAGDGVGLTHDGPDVVRDDEDADVLLTIEALQEVVEYFFTNGVDTGRGLIED